MLAAIDWVNLAGVVGIILTAIGTIATVVAKGRNQINRVEGAVTTASGSSIENAGTVLREWLRDLQQRLEASEVRQADLEERERNCQEELKTLRKMIGRDVDGR